MQPTNLAVALAVSLGMAPAAQSAPKPPHEDHSVHAVAVPVPAQRWASDAPLREGMRRVHVALDDLHQYEIGRMPEQMALERVAAIESATAYMFANCKLPPEPDAVLHGMLAPLLAGAAGLRRDPKDIAAVARMRDAVADYPIYFDDPR
jgi:hypothetical protein